MRHLIKVFLSTLTFTILSASIFAGGVIKIKETSSDGTSTISQLFVQDGMMKVIGDQAEDNTIMIFDSKNQIMTIADLDRKTYMEITKSDIEKMAKQMSGINKQMEEALKNVPPEQRAMMEQMMKDQMPGMQGQDLPSKTEFKKVASGVQVGGWTTDKYEGYKDGTKTEVVWIAGWGNTSLKDEYMNVFKGMINLFEEFTKSMGSMAASMEHPFDAELFEHGFPIKTEDFRDGKITSTSLVEEILEQNLSADVFSIPPGLKKENPFERME